MSDGPRDMARVATEEERRQKEAEERAQAEALAKEVRYDGAPPFDILPQPGPDSKMPTPCPVCAGVRYGCYGLPRLAWCAGCGRTWYFDGRPGGIRPEKVGDVPPTALELKAWEAAAQEAYNTALAKVAKEEGIENVDEIPPALVRPLSRRAKAQAQHTLDELVARRKAEREAARVKAAPSPK